MAHANHGPLAAAGVRGRVPARVCFYVLVIGVTARTSLMANEADWAYNFLRRVRIVELPVLRGGAMRRLLYFGAGILVGLAIQAATAQNPNRGIVGLNHVGISVPNRDQAVAY